MSDEDKTFSGSLVLNLMTSRAHALCVSNIPPVLCFVAFLLVLSFRDINNFVRLR